MGVIFDVRKEELVTVRTVIIRKWILAGWWMAALVLLLASGQTRGQQADLNATRDGSQCTVDADCDNGLFCDGAETCDLETGSCRSGTAPDCGDGVSCTTDFCDDKGGACRHVPDDAACDDGLFCTGTETCDADLGCRPGTDPCDGAACDEAGDACPECVVDADCDDGRFCNGFETCDEGACRAGSDPCPGQSCDESNGACAAGDACGLRADFESGAGGWTGDTGDCSAGDFVAGEPDATTWQAGGGNPGSAFFTAPNHRGLDHQDVDGGTCEALSPAIACAGQAAAEVTIDYFHGQRDAGDDAGDGFTIEVLSDGTVVDTLVSIGDVTTSPEWVTASTTVDGPGDLRLRVRATDAAGNSDIVEGGIDNARICPTGSADGPSIVITSPGDGDILAADAPVELNATASDPQDGDLSGRISWRSSLDGYLGTCEPVWATLSPGTHTLTASVTDSQGFCSSAQILVVVIGAPGGPGGPPACPTVAPTEADLDWRWIALKEDPDDACPEVPAWTEEPLFDVPGEPIHCVPPPLRSPCIYTFSGSGPVPMRAIDQLNNAPRLTCRHPTRMAVSPASGPPPAGVPTKSLGDDLAGCFLGAAGGIETASGQPPPQARVRLAVLDTAPTMEQNPMCVLSSSCAPAPPAEPRPPSSPHGPTLGAFADALLCDGAMACGVKVTSQLAMPFKDFDREIPQPPLPNGYVGTIDELAAAIWDERVAFDTAGTELHLILNLALAWRRPFGGSEPLAAAMPLDVGVVYHVLTFVVEEGALVVAAAGNAPDGCHAAPGGPLYPAAWERRPAPASPGSTSTYRPLLYAAAAVHDDGRPLVNAQPDSLPPLVAYGDHAVVRLPYSGAGDPFSGTLTGSSVSTAVVSAAAATVWSRTPGLAAADVMERLYFHAAPVASLGDPDFCLETAPGPPRCRHPDRTSVKRVSPCGAVSGSACALVPASCAPPFGGAVEFGVRAIPGSSCPLVPPPALPQQPWVFPQPGSNLCPNCGYGPSQRLAGRIGEGTFAAGAGTLEVTELFVELCQQTFQLLPPGTVTAGTSFYADLPAIPGCGTPVPNPVLTGTIEVTSGMGPPILFTASAPVFVSETPSPP